MGWGPVANGDGAGFFQKPREKKVVGQQEALAKVSRALAPSGARDSEAPSWAATSGTDENRTRLGVR